MNRILFEPDEIHDGVATFGGVRATHVLNVLHGEVGQTLKTGEIGGPIGTSRIVEIVDSPDGGPRVRVTCDHGEESLKPWIDLVLAPPRPRVMKRLLPQLAAMGVGQIVLVGAKKVEKDFWGATLLKEENYRPLLVDGLMQAGTSILPTLETRRNFRAFVRDELDARFPRSRRLVAHPEKGGDARRPESASGSAAGAQILLAVGPEGGWTDDEIELLEAHGFGRCSLGPRILRTDTAVIALLARLQGPVAVFPAAAR